MTIQPLTEQIKRSRHLIIPNKTIYAMNIAYTLLTSYIDLRLCGGLPFRPLVFLRTSVLDVRNATQLL
jgi:hypothetical protein